MTTKGKVNTGAIAGASVGLGLIAVPAFDTLIRSLPPTPSGELLGNTIPIATDKVAQITNIGPGFVELTVKVGGAAIQQILLSVGQSTILNGVKITLQETKVDTQVGKTVTEAWFLFQNLPPDQMARILGEWGFVILAFSLTVLAITNRDKVASFVIQKMVMPTKQKLTQVKDSVTNLLRNGFEQLAREADAY